eukprot:4412232-Amphidinium_carterae.1
MSDLHKTSLHSVPLHTKCFPAPVRAGSSAMMSWADITFASPDRVTWCLYVACLQLRAHVQCQDYIDFSIHTCAKDSVVAHETLCTCPSQCCYYRTLPLYGALPAEEAWGG